MPTQTSYDKRTASVREKLAEFNKDIAQDGSYKNFGKWSAPKAEDEQSLAKLETMKQDILSDVKDMVQSLDNMRKGTNQAAPVDISLSEMVTERYGFSRNEKTGISDSFFRTLGIDPTRTTLDYLHTMSEHPEAYRWLVPELMREPIRLGMRRNPLFPNLIAFEQNISQPSIKMPAIDMSDARVTKIGEAETIPVGKLSFNQKEITLQKLGVGLTMSYEVIQYTPLNLMGIFFEDMGVQLAMGQDVHLIDTLINGDGNSNGAAVIGVDSAGTITYKDILRPWIQMGVIGRMPQSMLSNLNMALDILTLAQFTNRETIPAGTNQSQMINLRTPVPQAANYDVHGAMPTTNQVMLIDRNSAIGKFNSSALRMENDRIVQRQIEGAFATLTTGYAILFRDGRLIIDKSLAYASNALPSWMDGLAVQGAADYLD